ncbi:hypothetical protein [Bosea sp. (in: a-proteobacteria)]|uniref:hypothetical protein n=1 Tax=Bosea sp. (in: a-proteobacteria) TaxID=1871050 RepID=UPI0040346349
MAKSEKLKAELKVILSNAKEMDAVRESLGILFPRLVSELDLVVSSDQMDVGSRLRSRRLSQSDFSASYFRLDPKPFTWSRSEIEGVINSDDPFSVFNEFHRKIEQSPPSERSRLARIYLDILRSSFESIITITQLWLDAIVLNSFDLIRKDDDVGEAFSFSNADRLRSLVVKALERLSEDDRGRIFLASVLAADDLTLLCGAFRTIAGDVRADGVNPGRVGFGFGDWTDRLRDHLLSRVRELAETAQIWSQASPRDLLWFWWGSVEGQEVYEFVSKSIDSGAGLSSILEITIGKITSSSGSFERVNHKIWSEIIDMARLEQVALSIFANATNPDDQARAGRFLKALEKGRDEDW